MHRVLITGQNRGLGQALAKKFMNNDHFVMPHRGRSDFDLSKNTDIVGLADRAKNNNINILVNNAAIVCPNISLEEYSIKQIEDMINVNLLAPILLSHLLLSQLDYIININSMVGLEIKTPRTLYSATKWGLRGFSNSLKQENKDLKILDVYPTNIKTTPDRQNAMELDFVVDSIYDSFIKNQEKLILDGRKI